MYASGTRRSYRRSRSYTPRSSTSTGNSAVKRDYKKAATAPRTKPAANKSAIMTLSRQVKALQVSKIGAFQKEFQYCQLGDGSTKFKDIQPLLFALNDMTHRAPIFIGSRDNTVTPAINGHVIDANWLDASPYGGGPNNEDFSYWKNANSDTADKVGYMPISTKVNFNMQVENMQTNQEIWFRIDIIKMKKSLLYSNLHKLALPNNVQGLARLASNSMADRNRINREFFTVIKTKWVKFSNDHDQSRTLKKFFTYSLKFPKQKSVETMSASDTLSTSTGTLPQTFYTNVPQDDIYWCLVNTNLGDNSGQCKLEMTRYISYRDKDKE